MRLVYTLEMPEATPSNNSLRGAHFHAYKSLRRRWRGMVCAAATAAVAQPARMKATGSTVAGSASEREPLSLAHIEVERHCAGALDWDNALGGLKPLLDCLVSPSARNPDGQGFILDDSPRCLPRAPAMTQHTAKRGASRTVVRIYALDALETAQ